jgi:hypothetical protein
MRFDEMTMGCKPLEDIERAQDLTPDDMVMFITDHRILKQLREHPHADLRAMQDLIGMRVDAPRWRPGPAHRIVPARDVALAVLVAALHVRRAT